MEHPLIGNLDSLTMDELQTKISELTQKLSWAARTGHGDLVGQIRMAIESYQTKFMEKQQALWDESRRKGNDYSDKINIS